MKPVSCFVDETGQQDMRAGYYMLTLVFHDQTKSIVAMRYASGDESATYLQLFGKPRNFKQNLLKQARRKAIG